MKLTGLQIFKYLPGGKKEKEANCKKCGFSTCMAFAMKLAKCETSIQACEYISEELSLILEEANRVQQAEIIFGPPENQIKAGNETVMFRHDKKFVNPTVLAVKIESSSQDFDEKLRKIKNYSVERVGQKLKIDAVALFDTDETFFEKAEIIAESKVPFILVSKNFQVIKNLLEKIKEFRPLVYLEKETLEEISEIGKIFNVPVVISGNNLEDIVQKSDFSLNLGYENIVLNYNTLSKTDLIQNLTYIRRAAVEDKYRLLGFPVITFLKDIQNIEKNSVENAVWASTLMCKYSNIVVLEEFNEAVIYSLLTLRQNIFTDPEKPLQIEAKVYLIGEPDETSPVFVTTNFALTYFTVAGEIEASNIPAFLVITPSDGMSVLTAWSAEKLTGQIIAKAIKDFSVEKLVNHRKLIIPGLVSVLKEEIEEELPDWEIIIGTNDAVDIVDFLKEYRIKYL